MTANILASARLPCSAELLQGLQRPYLHPSIQVPENVEKVTYETCVNEALERALDIFEQTPVEGGNLLQLLIKTEQQAEELIRNITKRANPRFLRQFFSPITIRPDLCQGIMACQWLQALRLRDLEQQRARFSRQFLSSLDLTGGLCAGFTKWRCMRAIQQKDGRPLDPGDLQVFSKEDYVQILVFQILQTGVLDCGDNIQREVNVHFEQRSQLPAAEEETKWTLITQEIGKNRSRILSAYERLPYDLIHASCLPACDLVPITSDRLISVYGYHLRDGMRYLPAWKNRCRAIYKTLRDHFHPPSLGRVTCEMITQEKPIQMRAICDMPHLTSQEYQHVFTNTVRAFSSSTVSGGIHVPGHVLWFYIHEDKNQPEQSRYFLQESMQSFHPGIFSFRTKEEFFKGVVEMLRDRRLPHHWILCDIPIQTQEQAAIV